MRKMICFFVIIAATLIISGCSGSEAKETASNQATAKQDITFDGDWREFWIKKP